MKRILILIVIIILNFGFISPAYARFGRRTVNKPAGTTTGAISFIVMGVIILWIGNGSRKFKNMIAGIPEARIDSLQPGLTKIYGAIEGATSELFESPLLKSKCIYYDCKIIMPRSRINTQYITLFKELKSQPFWLRDRENTGVILVNSGDRQLEIKRRVDGSGGNLMKYLPPMVNDLISARSKSLSRYFALNKFVRYDERLLSIGDEVLVIGTAVPMDSSVTNPLPNKATSHYMISATDRKSFLYITNNDETVVIKRYRKKYWIQLTIGLGAIITGIILL